MTLLEDTLLENRYRIDGLLGQGGMGAIYRGFDTRLKRQVAIKENFFQTPEATQQFEQEALMLADLNHPNLPRVIDHFSFEGQQYLVMDFIKGQDLWEIIKQQARPLPEAQALDYIIQVCQAVDYLHSQQPPIVHRDIKPQNIKITPDGQAVLVDFGIAKVFEEGQHTSTGARGITPGFSPLEQYGGIGTSPVSDVYSLGATLYAVLTGQKPPDSASRMVNEAEFVPPVKLNAQVSAQVSQAIEHAMQPQPADRPQSVAAWQHQLETIQAEMRMSISEDAPTIMTANQQPRRKSFLASLFSKSGKKVNTTPPKKPIVAALLSLFLLGGSGQIYLGQVKKGFAFIAITIFWFVLGNAFPTIGGLACLSVGLVPIISAVDAYRLTHKINEGETIYAWQVGGGRWMRRFFIVIVALTLFIPILGIIIRIT